MLHPLPEWAPVLGVTLEDMRKYALVALNEAHRFAAQGKVHEATVWAREYGVRYAAYVVALAEQNNNDC